MKLSRYTIVAGALASAVVIVGCASMFVTPEDSGGTSTDGASTTTGAATTTTDTASGYFVPGSHDIAGGGPPLPPEVVEVEGEETQSHFRAIQLDPILEDTAGAKFIVPADMDGDGLIDLVSGHNESQPVQLHLQRRNDDGSIYFQTVGIGGTYPIGTMAGVEVADLDEDGALDVVVLVKHTGELAFCLSGDENTDAFTGVIVLLFAPSPGGDITDGDSWEEVVIEDSHSAMNSRWGRPTDTFRAIDMPEDGGYTSLAVGQIDGVNGPDIVVTSNVPSPDCNTGQNVVELWLNPGASVRDGSPQNISTNSTPNLTMPPRFWYPIWLDIDAPTVRDCTLLDVDGDGDLDVISAYSNSVTMNVRWHRNPLVESGANALLSGVFLNGNRAMYSTTWERRPIGTVDADVGAMTTGDMDGDGFDDLLVRSFSGSVALWFRRPTADTDIEPVFPPPDPALDGDQTPVPDRFDFPWQVYVLDDFSPFRPIGLAVGDLTNDGLNDAVVSVGGALYWFDPSLTASIFDEWGRDFVLDDTKANGSTDDPTDMSFVDDGTIMNGLIIVDLDGDGVNDIVATFDRRVNSGLADDTIVWFRNTLFDVDTN